MMNSKIEFPENRANQTLLQVVEDKSSMNFVIVLFGENVDEVNYDDRKQCHVSVDLFKRWGGKFYFEDELDTFTFMTREEASDFAKIFHKMSASELMLLQYASHNGSDESTLLQ